MCEERFLIRNPGKADSQLAALEYGWVTLGKHTDGSLTEPALGSFAGLQLPGG